MPITDKPEELARQRTDEMLEAASWLIQDHDAINVDAGPGVAVREFPVTGGEAHRAVATCPEELRDLDLLVALAAPGGGDT